jgi:hypothetical protein
VIEIGSGIGIEIARHFASSVVAIPMSLPTREVRRGGRPRCRRSLLAFGKITHRIGLLCKRFMEAIADLITKAPDGSM